MWSTPLCAPTAADITSQRLSVETRTKTTVDLRTSRHARTAEFVLRDRVAWLPDPVNTVADTPREHFGRLIRLIARSRARAQPAAEAYETMTRIARAGSRVRVIRNPIGRAPIPQSPSRMVNNPARFPNKCLVGVAVLHPGARICPAALTLGGGAVSHSGIIPDCDLGSG